MLAELSDDPPVLLVERRVLTPARYRSATTDTNARSEQLRGSKSQCGW
jgi:hypothetical protein